MLAIKGLTMLPCGVPVMVSCIFSRIHDTCTREFPEEVSDFPVRDPFLYRFYEPPVRIASK